MQQPLPSDDRHFNYLCPGELLNASIQIANIAKYHRIDIEDFTSQVIKAYSGLSLLNKKMPKKKPNADAVIDDYP